MMVLPSPPFLPGRGLKIYMMPFGPMSADAIFWGRTYEMRVVFDGNNYLVTIDGEPVLYRALTDFYADVTPLTIRRVGIVSNWEWGHDTGSEFLHFSGWEK